MPDDEKSEKVFGGVYQHPRIQVGKCRWTAKKYGRKIGSCNGCGGAGVEIEVADCWVEDGFEATAERVHDMVCRSIGYCRHDEIKVRLVEAPDRKIVRELQGYPPAKEK